MSPLSLKKYSGLKTWQLKLLLVCFSGRTPSQTEPINIMNSEDDDDDDDDGSMASTGTPPSSTEVMVKTLNLPHTVF